MLDHVVLLLTLAASALGQKTHYVTVGGSNGQAFFAPHFVKADPQDVVSFWFNPKNNSVTQSTFATPCLPLAGGFDSGFNPVTIGTAAHDRPSFNYTVVDNNPVWVYSRQGEGTSGSYCAIGMVFAVNPGDRHADSSFKNFKKNAIAEAESLPSAPVAQPAPVSSPAASPDPANLNTLDALDSSPSGSTSSGLGSYGPAIVGLLAGILIALLGLLGVGVMMYIRRGARPGRSMRMNTSSYAPVGGHMPPMTDSEGYHEEPLTAPLKYSEQGL